MSTRSLLTRWRAWTRRKQVAAVLGVLALLGIGGLVSGVVPIAASAGHWAITEHVLHFAMRRSVATHAIGIEVPADLDDRERIVRGAGHFEVGCRPCHGAPGRGPGFVATMLPVPPDLVVRAPQLDAAEQFYVVKHGVKLTGMPGWPVQTRDDEVWDMVAFLQVLPDLEPSQYAALVGATPRDRSAESDAPAVVTQCAGCHGTDGEGREGGAFPRLGGQREGYLLASLRAYAQGERASGTMGAIAAQLSEDEIRRVARWYATRPHGALSSRTPAAIARSSARADPIGEVPQGRLADCGQCHGAGEHRAQAAYPYLAGQHGSYLRRQLVMFREGRRGGGEHCELMNEVAAHGLPDASVDALVAAYAESRDPL